MTAAASAHPILVAAMHGNVFGIDRVTGEVRWKHALEGDGEGEVFVAMRDDLVVVAADGDALHALDYLTGAVRWRVDTIARGRATIVIEPECVVCAKGGYVDGFDHQGRRLWSLSLVAYGRGRLALGFPGNVAQADDPGS